MFTISLSVFIYNHKLFVFLPLSSCSGLQSVKGHGRIPAHVAQGTDVHRHVTTLRAPAPRSVERGRKRESDGRRACRLLRTRPWVVSPSLNHITDISRYTVRIDVLQMFFRQVLFYFFIMFHTVFCFLFSLQYDSVGRPARQKNTTAGRGLFTGGVWTDRVHQCKTFSRGRLRGERERWATIKVFCFFSSWRKHLVFFVSVMCLLF